MTHVLKFEIGALKCGSGEGSFTMKTVAWTDLDTLDTIFMIIIQYFLRFSFNILLSFP